MLQPALAINHGIVATWAQGQIQVPRVERFKIDQVPLQAGESSS
jgi:hypothetical protein